MEVLIYIILVCIILFFVRKFLSKFKFPKVGSIALFTGGVKVGKSAVSLGCALKNYKSVRFRWKVRCAFRKFANMFRKEKLALFEEPYFYSTIPVSGVKYIHLSRDHLLRKQRIRRGSVVFIDEASLVADSQLIKDKYINSELLLFFKLFGHECGGLCVINTHCISDLHYALKRTTSQYFYVHSLSKWIPFFTVANVREERYSEDGSTLNVYAEDVENSLKRVIMRKSIFKRYDSYCFSYLTDHLPVDGEDKLNYIGRKGDLKAKEVVSFRPEFYNLLSRKEIEIINEKKND